MTSPHENLLELQGLKKHYPIRAGVLRQAVGAVRALDGIDLSIRRGECLGLVGESGCGKTTTGKAVIRLHEPTAGQIRYHPSNGDGRQVVDLAALSRRALNRQGLRAKLQMVFQDPHSSLNPRFTVRDIIAEPLVVHRYGTREEIERDVRAKIEVLGRGGGYMCAPAHIIQSDTSIESVEAFIAAVKEHGQYS